MKTTWSVELKTCSYSDDVFNGTYDDCCEYIRKNQYRKGEYIIAKIEVNNEGMATYTLDEVYDIEKEKRN